MIGESFINWFVNNFILTSYIDYKKPGYIIVSFKSEGKEVYFRDLLLPEELFVDIEKRVVEEYKDKGKQVLYNIGVTLGYIFADMFNVPTVKTHEKNKLENYFNFAFKFNFSTWAKSAKIDKLDIDNHSVDFLFDDHIICRKNGLGLIITTGAEAGSGKFFFADDSLEVVQIKCCGKGDKFCQTIWRSDKELKKQKIDFIKGKCLDSIKNYGLEKENNLVKPATFCKKAAFDYIQAKIFVWKDNKLTFKDNTLFDCNAILYYLIEVHIGELKKGDKLLFDIGFNYGKKIGINNSAQLIPDLLSSLGFGDTVITQSNNKIQITIKHFPWSVLEKNVKEFSLMKGFTSGILSEALKRNVILTSCEKILQGNDFILILKE